MIRKIFMKIKKLYPTLAGIFYLLSSVFLLLEFVFPFPIDIFFTSNESIILVLIIFFSWFLAYVLLAKKRNKLLPIALIIQVIYFCCPEAGYFIYVHVPSICPIFIVYASILSIIFKKCKYRKIGWPLIIVWFVLYIYFVDYTYYVFSYNSLLLIFFLLYTAAWTFILLWILFPCKKEKTAESKTKANTNQQSSKPFPSSVQTANQNLHIQQPNGSFNNNQKPSQSDYSSAGKHKQYSKEQELNILTKQLDCLVHQKVQHQQSSQHTGQYSNSQQAGFSSQQNYQQSNYFDTQKPLQQNGKNQKPQQNTAKQKTVRQCPVCFSTVSEDALYCEICRSKLK